MQRWRRMRGGGGDQREVLAEKSPEVGDGGDDTGAVLILSSTNLGGHLGARHSGWSAMTIPSSVSCSMEGEALTWRCSVSG